MRVELEIRDNNYFPARVLPERFEFVRTNWPLPLEVDNDLPILSCVELGPRVLNYEPTVAFDAFGAGAGPNYTKSWACGRSNAASRKILCWRGLAMRCERGPPTLNAINSDTPTTLKTHRDKKAFIWAAYYQKVAEPIYS